MPVPFLLYGSNGFVGDAIARLAVQQGLQPILAGRNAERVAAQAAKLNLSYRVFPLDDPSAIDNALTDVPVVLHCAGPYRYTSRPMADACIRTRVHYLDLTGEIPVLSALAARDTEARIRGVMLLPAVGFDVVPTDCLAAHLKQRLPTATRLAIAFHTHGPAGLPPGTANTMLETIPLGFKLRRAGKLVNAPREGKTRLADFGSGPVTVTRLPWGDAFTAFHSTGIPDIVDYSTLTPENVRQMELANRLRLLFRLPFVRKFARRLLPSGSTADERAQTTTSVWGEVCDEQGRTAVSRLHGPEAGVVWTSITALAAVRKVLDDEYCPGFQTPAMAYGPDFVLQAGSAVREDL